MDEKGNIIKKPDFARMEKDFFAVSVNDKETRQTIKEVNQKFGVVLEPHGAVAWKSMKDYLKKHNEDVPVVSLETAHPSKFPEELNKIGITSGVHPNLKLIDLRKEEHILELNPEYNEFYDFLKDFLS